MKFELKKVYATKEIDEWIIERLPDDLPEKAVLKGLSDAFDYLGFQDLQVCERGDHGRWSCRFRAESKDDLLKWAFCAAAGGISMAYELSAREKNALKWRYSRTKVRDGHWCYDERKDYVYNAIEDTRLVWFELYLRLIKAVLPFDEWLHEADQHTRLMNTRFVSEHWDYDRNEMRFVEISGSREHDENGNEEPGDCFVIRLI